MSTTLTGTIKRLIPKRGFGWIRTEDGNDYFFHHSELKNCTFKDVDEGDAVSFVPVPDSPKGPRAVGIDLL